MMMDQGGPCDMWMYVVHMLLGGLQAFTAITVAWLSNRAKKRDRAEARRNGNNPDNQ